MSDLLETLAKSSADRAYVLPLSRYGYLTVAQLALLFQAGSPNYVRERLEDLRRRGLVERIRPMRVGSGGKRAYVFFLTNEGQAAARALLDLPEERYRQSEREEVGTYFLDHTLAVNNVLISLELLCHTDESVSLHELRTEPELRRAPVRVPWQGKSVSVIHDAWVALIVERQDKRLRVPVAIECDRSTIQHRAWRERVAIWLAYLHGPYQAAFAPTVRFAILCPGNPKRAEVLVSWTEAVLTREQRQGDSQIFCFSGADPTILAPAALFDGPVWRQPFGKEQVPLLPGSLLHA